MRNVNQADRLKNKQTIHPMIFDTRNNNLNRAGHIVNQLFYKNNLI